MSSWTTDKDFGRSRDENEWRPHSKFDSYTTLNISWERILTECANIDFKEAEIRNPYPVRESAWFDKSKYCCFHKSHYQYTNGYIQLKDTIWESIKNGCLSEYINNGKSVQKYSPKKK